jgi:DNA repair protein RecO (recombination protein O)
MADLQRYITSKGIILTRNSYKETSEILEILSPALGKINSVAKGVKRPHSKLLGIIDILNELDLELYYNPGSNWYTIKSAVLERSHSRGLSLQQNILVGSAAELFRQMELANDDWEKLYDLFVSFSDYVRNINDNPIAIFWRFLLNMFKQLGIALDLSECSVCHKRDTEITAFSTKYDGLVCSKCRKSFRSDTLLSVSAGSKEIFRLMPSIGKHLDKLKIDNVTIKEINRILLIHLSEKFQKRFHLRSMDIFDQIK